MYISEIKITGIVTLPFKRKVTLLNKIVKYPTEINRSENVSNEELVANIKAGIDTADNMLQLWKQTKAFVASIAKKYKPYAEWDDLMQEGYLALNVAAEGYDPQRSGSFLTYAGLCITGRMK